MAGRRRSRTGPIPGRRAFAVDCDLIVVVVAAQCAQSNAVQVAVAGPVGVGRRAGRRRRREESRRRRRLLQAGQEIILIVAEVVVVVVVVVAGRAVVVTTQAGQVVMGRSQERGQSVHHPVGFRIGVNPAEELVAQRRELMQREIGRSAGAVQAARLAGRRGHFGRRRRGCGGRHHQGR